MKRVLLSFIGLTVAILLTGCDTVGELGSFPRVTDTEKNEDPIMELITDLRSTGTEVGRSGTVSQPFFSVDGHRLTVDDETVQVFAYATDNEADAEAAGISPDGSSFRQEGSAMIVTWIDSPHFFRRDALLVLYVGDSDEVVKALEKVLGSQFAGQ